MSKNFEEYDCSAVKMSILQLNKVHICKSVPCDIIDQTWLKVKKNWEEIKILQKIIFLFLPFFYKSKLSIKKLQ